MKTSIFKIWFVVTINLLLCFSSVAMAGEVYTINSSEEYVDDATVNSLLDAFVPFVQATQGFCSGGNCEAHGQDAANSWASDTFFGATHTDDDGTARNKFVPRFGSSGNINWANQNHQSIDIFGIGLGLPDEWKAELDESSSADECGSYNDSLTTPGREWGRSRTTDGGTDNCTFNYVNGGGGGGGGAPPPGSYEDWQIQWLAFYDSDPGGFGVYTTNAEGAGCTFADANPHNWSEAEWDCFFNAMVAQFIMPEFPVHAAAPPDSIDPVGREEWVDQILIGYIETGDNFAQNFRTQLTFGDSSYYGEGDIPRSGACLDDQAECFTITDFRLEQGDTDMENVYQNAQTDSNGTLRPVQTSGNKRLINAFQLTMTTMSSPNTSPGAPSVMREIVGCSETKTSPTTAGCVKQGMWAENIEQNMAGYFYTCINCNVQNEHSFSAPDKLLIQSWLTDNPTITSIIHTRESAQTNRRAGAFVDEFGDPALSGTMSADAVMVP